MRVKEGSRCRDKAPGSLMDEAVGHVAGGIFLPRPGKMDVKNPEAMNTSGFSVVETNGLEPSTSRV